MSSPAITGASSARLTAAAALTVPVWSIAGAMVAYLTSAAAALQVTSKITGAAAAELTARSPSLSALVDLGQVSGLLNCQTSARSVNSIVGLTVWDVALEIYGLFRIEVQSPTVLELARPRILAAINSVMQQIWSRADRLNYFNQESETVVVPQGQTEIALSGEVQNVIGPVKATTGKTLAPLSSKEAVDSYLDYWFGGVNPGVQPPAYWLDGSQDLAAGDRTSLKIVLPWEATEDYSLDLLVVKNVPRFTNSDLINATPIRLPAKYVELLFLPLLREWASQDYLFKSESARPGIAAAAAAAKEALGLLEPSPPVVKKAKQGDMTP